MTRIIVTGASSIGTHVCVTTISPMLVLKLWHRCWCYNYGTRDGANNCGTHVSAKAVAPFLSGTIVASTLVPQQWHQHGRYSFCTDMRTTAVAPMLVPHRHWIVKRNHK